MLPVLGFSACSATAVAQQPVAALRVYSERAEWMARIDGSFAEGYRFTVICTRNCSEATPYSQALGDSPLGLFKLTDDNSLVYSISGTAVALVIRVWSVTDRGVVQMLEAYSRGTPDFFNASDGVALIRTYERLTHAAENSA